MTLDKRHPTRRALIRALTVAVAAAPVVTGAKVYGYTRGAGDIRRIRLTSDRTGESADTIYWIDGEYVPEALDEITHFMRDWRNNKVHRIDARTVDIMAATQRLLDMEEPFNLISGYRSPETNAMLRRRSAGVAKYSLHLFGQAADIRLRSRSVDQIFRAATFCSGGGVGKYSSSNFVHMDCGRVRTWGR